MNVEISRGFRDKVVDVVFIHIFISRVKNQKSF